MWRCVVQVISPHQVMGIVEIVEHLSTVQDKVYDEPTVLVVDNVTGGGSNELGRELAAAAASQATAWRLTSWHCSGYTRWKPVSTAKNVFGS
jgi:hypothetical protein